MNDLNEEFLATLNMDLSGYGLHSADSQSSSAPQPEATSTLRRTRRRRGDEPIKFMALVEEDGVLRWSVSGDEAPARQPGLRRRGRRTLRRLKFRELPPNEATETLQNIDAKLTPQMGMHRVTARTLASLTSAASESDVVLELDQRPAARGRTLLFVHGTFSNCQKQLLDLAKVKEGRELLQHAIDPNGRYSRVLVFNHPTLSVSPMINAAMLARLMRDAGGPIDVVCHSRGGLVTRWWLEALDLHKAVQPGRAIFVGSPLAGTSLAAPARLKASFDLLANIARAVSTGAHVAGTLVPPGAAFFEASAALFALFGKVATLAAKTPLLDAGINLVPGLAGQQRVGNNHEILELQSSFGSLDAARRARVVDNYYYVKSNFDPALDLGSPWRFLKHFRFKAAADKVVELAGAAVMAGADKVVDPIFAGPNDLIVDTESMTDLPLDTPHRDRMLDFGASPLVHHTNYFQQLETIRFLEAKLLKGA